MARYVQINKHYAPCQQNEQQKCMIVSTDAQKALDKIQNPFKIKC
jgi:hypothetical protein